MLRLVLVIGTTPSTIITSSFSSSLTSPVVLTVTAVLLVVGTPAATNQIVGVNEIDLLLTFF